MKSAVLIAPGRMCVQEVEMPRPGANQVRIRIEGCGVCGSNLAPWEGRDWFNYPFSPGGPGHEGWGEIEAVGADVEKWHVGDRVAALTYNAFAEYDVAPEDSVVALPPSLGHKPFPGEALGCAMNVLRRSDIQPGQTVAILGIGFLGALLTRLAVRAGAKVIALGRRPFSLELAQSSGAAEMIVLDDARQAVMRVKELTAGAGCDRVIEAAGVQCTLDLAAEITRERGRLIIAGYHQDGSRKVNMQLWNWRGLDVINAHERVPAIYIQGMRDAVKAVGEGVIDPTPLYTHTFRLEHISEAFIALQQRPHNFLKALITT